MFFLFFTANCFARIPEPKYWQTTDLYDGRISKSIKNKYYAAALYYYRVAKKNGLLSESICSHAMYAAIKIKRHEQLLAILEKAEANGMLNADIYPQIIHSLDDFEKALGVFRKAVSNEEPDANVYAAIISVANKKGNHEEALELFDEAKENKILNANVYAATIYGAYKTEKYEKALELFDETELSALVDKYADSHSFYESQTNRMLNADIYYTTILATKKNHDCKKALSIINDIEHGEIIPYDPTEYSVKQKFWIFIIKLECKIRSEFTTPESLNERHFKKTLALFEDRKRYEIPDANAFTIVIYGADKAGNYKKVLELFDEAKANKRLNASIYAVAIFAANKAGNYKKALALFDETRAHKMLNENVYNNIIYVAKKYRGCLEALSIIDDIESGAIIPYDPDKYDLWMTITKFNCKFKTNIFVQVLAPTIGVVLIASGTYLLGQDN